MRLRTLLALLPFLAACEGPMGPRGFRGPTGPVSDGGGTLPDAASDAASDAAADAGDVTDAALVEAGASGLSGHVRDPSGALLATGRVVLVPAARVAALASTPIDLALSGAEGALAMNDEPLEDPIASDPALPNAALAADGSFHFADLPQGEQFVVYVPAADDPFHLPGGQLARRPFAAEALVGATLELRVSGAASPAARFVGSGSCVTCHARHTQFASGHALTTRVPGISTFQQDAAGSPRIDEALAAFVAGTRLYFSECSSSAASDKSCRVDTTLPTGGARLTVQLGREPSLPETAVGHYFVELTDSATTVRYPLALTLGGARTLQQFVARLPLGNGHFAHFVLPFSYQLAGDATRSDFIDLPWVAYRVQDWLDLTSGALRAPSSARAFERDCAGCHATGFSLRGGESEGYRGSAVADSDGVYDLDGDERKELLAVGCEACHGPGSEHLEVAPRGQRIVSPALLTPERQSLLCGTCHARHRGKHDELAPLDLAGYMPRAGLSRSAFLAQHVARIDGPLASYPSGDPRVPYAQYDTFLRSPKYRSSQLLVTCTDCHDPHRRAGFASDLREPSPDASCSACHRAESDVMPHVAAKLKFRHDVGTDRTRLTCTQCHMVKTGSSGARLPALRDVTDPDPATHETYFHGDRTSHRFVFTDRSQAAEQPVAATSGCSPCHGELLPVP